jgi:hypothetical protein
VPARIFLTHTATTNQPTTLLHLAYFLHYNPFSSMSSRTKTRSMKKAEVEQEKKPPAEDTSALDTVSVPKGRQGTRVQAKVAPMETQANSGEQTVMNLRYTCLTIMYSEKGCW